MSSPEPRRSSWLEEEGGDEGGLDMIELISFSQSINQIPLWYVTTWSKPVDCSWESPPIISDMESGFCITCWALSNNKQTKQTTNISSHRGHLGVLLHHLLGPRERGSKLEITTIIAHIGDDMREDSMSGFCITFWAIWAIWGLLFKTNIGSS